MTTLSTLNENMVAERYFLLPEALRKALGSEDIKSKITKLVKAAGFEEPAILALQSVVGEIFLGFVHTDTMGKELEEVLGMDKETADMTSRWLMKEIFEPYREYIDKVYAPSGDASLYKSASPPAPPKSNVPPPAPLPPVSVAAKAAPVPTPLKINPLANPPVATSIPKAPESKQAPVAPSGTALAPTLPQPFIMRKETTAAAVAPQFKLNMDPKLFSGAKPTTPSMPLPPKPAQLEFGAKEWKKPGDAVVKFEPDAQRIVHYSDFRTKNIGISAAPAPIKAVSSLGAPPAPTTPKMVDIASPPKKENVPLASPKPIAEPLQTPNWNSSPLPPRPALIPKATEPPREVNLGEGQGKQ